MKTQKKNVLLITADSFRFDGLGSASGKGLTPALDQLTGQSFFFQHAYSSGPNTPHAFPAIMSAENALVNRRLSLHDAPLTLAEAFQRSGWHTVGFNAANPYLSKHFAYQRGFGHFEDFVHLQFNANQQNGLAANPNAMIALPDLKLEQYLVNEETMREKSALEAHFLSHILSEMSGFDDRPFFLWTHFMDTHYPYVPTTAAQRESGENVISSEESFNLNFAVRENSALSAAALAKVKSLYNACVLQLDTKIAGLLSFFQQRNLLDDMLVVFCADHGEEFMEHGDLLHKSKLFDELIHVPLLIKLPGQRNCAVTNELAGLIQLAPTICNAVGVDHEFRPDGLSMNDSGSRGSNVFSAASIGPDGGVPVDGNMGRIDRMPKVYSLIGENRKILVDTRIESPVSFDLISDTFEKTQIPVAGNDEMMMKLDEHIVKLEEQRIRKSAFSHALEWTGKRGFAHAV